MYMYIYIYDIIAMISKLHTQPAEAAEEPSEPEIGV